MDKKVRTEIYGRIVSVALWNDVVNMTLETYSGLANLKIPYRCCNVKKWYKNDFVKISGTVNKYEMKNSIYEIIFTNCILEKQFDIKTEKSKLDYNADFSFLGHIVSIELVEENFYKVFFKTAEDEEIYTIYFEKSIFESAMEEFDFRRLIYLYGKFSAVSYKKYSYNEAVSEIRYYGVGMKYL
ncbi:MAG: hypothetical protein IKV81_01955 [Clostridia bacterium]|nr:hypothetical protein [Clostridia bacterium]